MFKYVKGINSFFVLNPKMHQAALDAMHLLHPKMQIQAMPCLQL